MRDLFRLASEIQGFCQDRNWGFCFIGGLALQRWGEPRETVDVDVTLVTGFGGEEPFITALLDRYDGRIPDAAGFARTNRVLLLRAASGVGIDVALGGLPFEERIVERASLFPFPGDVPLRTCSAEDLVVLKAFADRARDWADIEGVLVRTGRQMHWATVEVELPPLCEAKEAPHILPRLRSLRASLET